MIKNNFLFNVDNKIRWESGEIDHIQLLVEASNESEAKEIAAEELMNKNRWWVNEVLWQELAQSRHYLSRENEKSVYTLTDKDVEQLVVRYENAKMESKRLQRMGNSECRFEAGRAYALESVLRDIGLDYTDVASGRFYEEE